MTHAATVVMVEPRDFGFNSDTAVDNAFQHHPDVSATQVQKQAMHEFWAMVEHLDKHHVDVITLSSPEGVEVPDAVFPNNWFSTNQTDLILYPMKAANRQLELQPDPLQQQLVKAGFIEPTIVDLRHDSATVGILEGTGALVFDHANKAVYGNLSERCEDRALQAFAERYQLRLHRLCAVTNQCVPIYHTNVLMAIGSEFVVIASDTLTSDEFNSESLEELRNRKTDVIPITEEQMVESFCGNIIQLASTRGDPVIIMSESARKGFTKAQLKQLESHGAIVSSAIDTIEYVGGGSARCMIAEIFLQKA